LGPVLFIIFINDMCYLQITAILMLFADDSTISFANKSISLLFSKLNEDLSIISIWLENNRLILKKQMPCFSLLVPEGKRISLTITLYLLETMQLPFWNQFDY
jgi:hypothetical protein